MYPVMFCQKSQCYLLRLRKQTYCYGFDIDNNYFTIVNIVMTSQTWRWMHTSMFNTLPFVITNMPQLGRISSVLLRVILSSHLQLAIRCLQMERRVIKLSNVSSYCIQ